MGSEEDVGSRVDGTPGVGLEIPGLPILELTLVLVVEDEVPGGGVDTDEVCEVVVGNGGGTFGWLAEDSFFSFRKIAREDVRDTVICRRTRGLAMAPGRGGGRGERNVRERERVVFEQGGRMSQLG